MYERFTDRARTVMQLANWVAHYFNYQYITSEHILLGLLQEGSGLAVNALKNLDIDPGTLWLEVEKIVPRGSYKFGRDRLPQTPCVKQVIADALEEAELLDHNYVGTEHLLLALIRQKESVAAQVLMNLGLKLEEVRGEVLRLLGREIPAEKISDTPPRPKAVPPGAENERIQSLERQLRMLHEDNPVCSLATARIRSLERQLWNVRVVLGALAGALAGALLAASIGAVLGLILGGGVAALGLRIPGALAGSVTGILLGSAHLPSEGGSLAGALLGTLAGLLIAEIGGPTQRRGFPNRWWR